MDDKSSSTIPSNEQVIDDLIGNLRNSCRTEESNKTSRANDGTDDKIGEASNDPWDRIGKDPDSGEHDHDTDLTPKDASADDFVNEEALKDREVTLSDDEKQVFTLSHFQYNYLKTIVL